MIIPAGRSVQKRAGLALALLCCAATSCGRSSLSGGASGGGGSAGGSAANLPGGGAPSASGATSGGGATGSVGGGASGAGGAGSGSAQRLLLMTKTAGYRHSSIPDGISATAKLAESLGVELSATEDSRLFTAASLDSFDAVMFLSTTGDILDSAQEQALQAFLESGGGFIGVHAATDTEPDWIWFRQYLGAHFESHPAVQTATLHVEVADHPATRALSDPWSRVDEWYNFDVNPRPEVDVLLTLDEASYSGGTMGDHPIAWAREQTGGRMFYTGLGHTPESYQEPEFLAHLAGGISWVLGLKVPE